MTQFDKEKFHYHGGYLTYHGTYEGQPTYDEVYGKDKIHPHVLECPLNFSLLVLNTCFIKVLSRTF